MPEKGLIREMEFSMYIITFDINRAKRPTPLYRVVSIRYLPYSNSIQKVHS